MLSYLTGLPHVARYALGALAFATLLVHNRLALVSARVERSNSVVIETAELLYVPRKEMTSALFLGYDQAAADITWLRTTEYFGRHFIGDRQYAWLEHFVDLILELDPRFRRVYHWAGTNVLYGRRFTNANVELSNRYYLKALEQFPTDWEAPYRLGMNYYVEMTSPDPDERARFRETGVQYLEMAANMPNAPDFLGRLVASLYRNLGKDEVALQYYIELMAETDDPAKREALRERMAQLGGAVDADAIAAAAAADDKRHKRTFPYAPRGLFLLVDRPDGDAVPDVSWRSLLPIFEAEAQRAGPADDGGAPSPTPGADDAARAQRAEAPR